jgi:hypothetical protein
MRRRIGGARRKRGGEAFLGKADMSVVIVVAAVARVRFKVLQRCKGRLTLWPLRSEAVTGYGVLVSVFWEASVDEERPMEPLIVGRLMLRPSSPTIGLKAIRRVGAGWGVACPKV